MAMFSGRSSTSGRWLRCGSRLWNDWENNHSSSECLFTLQFWRYLTYRFGTATDQPAREPQQYMRHQKSGNIRHIDFTWESRIYLRKGFWIFTTGWQWRSYNRSNGAWSERCWEQQYLILELGSLLNYILIIRFVWLDKLFETHGGLISGVSVSPNSGDNRHGASDGIAWSGIWCLVHRYLPLVALWMIWALKARYQWIIDPGFIIS